MKTRPWEEAGVSYDELECAVNRIQVGHSFGPIPVFFKVRP